MINKINIQRFFQIVLHLALIYFIASNITPLLNNALPSSPECKIIHYYGLLIVVISTIFLLVTMQFKQKVNSIPLALVIFCSLFSILLSAACIHRYFVTSAIGPLPLQIRFFLLFSAKMGFFALFIYISGFINKKLFWVLSAFALLYLLSTFIYYWNI